MSAKKAKLLRKLTQQVIDSRRADGHTIVEESLYVENEKNRKYAMVPKDSGGKLEHVVIAAGTILSSPDSERGVYRAVKKQLKKAGQ